MTFAEIKSGAANSAFIAEEIETKATIEVEIDGAAEAGEATEAGTTRGGMKILTNC